MNDQIDNTTNNSTQSNKEKGCMADCCVGGDYDVSLKMFSSKDDEIPECTHHMKGTAKHSIWKLLAIGGGIAAALALLICATHVFCSFVCKEK